MLSEYKTHETKFKIKQYEDFKKPIFDTCLPLAYDGFGTDSKSRKVEPLGK